LKHQQRFYEICTSRKNHFEGISTGDESWFQHSYPSSKIFSQLPADANPRTRQVIGTHEIMIMTFFTARKRIIIDTLPEETKFNQHYFADCIFPI
jgi:hypothetical protein